MEGNCTGCGVRTGENQLIEQNGERGGNGAASDTYFAMFSNGNPPDKHGRCVACTSDYPQPAGQRLQHLFHARQYENTAAQ